MKTDNRGFTLTELIVCIVIFSIVLLAVFGFMVAGARSYSNVDSRVARQLKSQLALGQIGDCLMNCNTGINIADSGNTVYILSKDSANNYTLQVFKLDATAKNIQYGSAAATPKTTDGVTSYSAAITTWSKVTSNADSFAVALTKPAADSPTVSAATVSLKFSDSATVYTKTVALRNTPPSVTITVAP